MATEKKTVTPEEKPVTPNNEQVMNELEAFTSLEADMRNMVELSINTFTQKLWCRGLIPDDVNKMLFDEEASISFCNRSYNFLMFIYDKAYVAKKEPGEAEEIINTLADIIGDDAALRDTAKTLRGCKFDHLREKMDDIAKAIHGNLNTIAASAFSQNLIGVEEYHKITDPTAKHSIHCTGKVLDAVRSTIKANPSKMEEFIGVLIDMGKPISDFAVELRLKMQKPLPPEK